MNIHALKPEVAREVLLLVAGLVWSGVGIMLGTWAVVWLTAASPSAAMILGAAGVACALVAWRFGFARLSNANIERIERLPVRACLFSFQAWKSYLIMASMIALGLVLRHSAIPKPWLAVVYSTIGGALFLSSLGYYRHFFRHLRRS